MLSILGNLAAIATAVVAVVGYWLYRRDLRQKRRQLEAYLMDQKSDARRDDKGQRSILHLMARVGMTEAELLHASFKSRHVGRVIAADPETNRAEALLLVYRP